MLQEMTADGASDYFTMKEMRQRNPLLYQHLVGRHLSREQARQMEPPAGQLCSLSSLLMAHMERDRHSSARRKRQEAELAAWHQESDDEDEEEEEVDEDDDEEEDEDEGREEGNGAAGGGGGSGRGRTPGLAEGERLLLQEEFVSTMYRSFIEGRDEDFDYSLVDDDPRYDDLELEERDAQDRYFDAD